MVNAIRAVIKRNRTSLPGIREWNQEAEYGGLEDVRKVVRRSAREAESYRGNVKNKKML